MINFMTYTFHLSLLQQRNQESEGDESVAQLERQKCNSKLPSKTALYLPETLLFNICRTNYCDVSVPVSMLSIC